MKTNPNPKPPKQKKQETRENKKSLKKIPCTIYKKKT